MKPHHKKAIELLTENLKKKKRFLALIICGSVAKGVERDDSDIDVVIVVSDEDFERRKKRNNIFYYTTQFCEYEGGYIDGKVVDLQFLKDVAEKGSEPARDAFRDSFIAFSKIPELEEILKKIPVYQKHEKEEKIGKFWAQFEYAKWALEEAEKRKDKYFINRCAADLILFVGRLILAHNEILFPFHKLFMISLRNAPEKPNNLMNLIDKFLEEKNSSNAQAIYDAIKDFSDWIKTPFWSIRFMRDVEWAWLEGKAAIGDI